MPGNSIDTAFPIIGRRADSIGNGNEISDESDVFKSCYKHDKIVAFSIECLFAMRGLKDISLFIKLILLLNLFFVLFQKFKLNI